MMILFTLYIALSCISVEAFSVTRGRAIVDESSSCLKLFRHRTQTDAITQDELDETSVADVIEAFNDDVELSKSIHKDRVETLRFGGKLSYTSQPFPIPSNITALKDFFTSPENQHVLLSGGKKDRSSIDFIDPSSLSPELIQLWKNQSIKVGGSEPMLDIDKVVRVIPAAIDIFTVKILPESLIGVAYRPREQNVNVHSSISAEHLELVQTVPEYQAVLIDDEPKAEGPSLLVWLFNKIVYGKDATNSRGKKRSESALLRVYVEPIDTTCIEDDNEHASLSHPSFVFKAESEMRMRFDFPYFLIRFFPMKKNRAEEICSVAISRALELNLEPAVENFSDLYLKSINK